MNILLCILKIAQDIYNYKRNINSFCKHFFMHIIFIVNRNTLSERSRNLNISQFKYFLQPLGFLMEL